MATLNEITSPDWSFSLAGTGQVVEDFSDINQCILIILSTVRGTDPLRPEFGVNIFDYIDLPVNTALPELIRECVDQITQFEPRVEITAVGKRVEGSSVTLIFNWLDVRAGKSGTTEQTFNLSR